jgi:hypothetical protein
MSLTLYTIGFFGSVLKSPIQIGLLSKNNLVTNILRLGTFKRTIQHGLKFVTFDKPFSGQVQLSVKKFKF